MRISWTKRLTLFDHALSLTLALEPVSKVMLGFLLGPARFRNYHISTGRHLRLRLPERSWQVSFTLFCVLAQLRLGPESSEVCNARGEVGINK